MQDRKKVFLQSKIVHMKIPLWPQLAIHRIWPLALRIRGILDYFPDEWTDSRKVNREFFFAIICTLAGDWITALIREIREQRENAAIEKKNSL